jgi:DNA-binding NarL/FixJ family response regulator
VTRQRLPGSPTVVILADDLIWASRLSDIVTAAAALPKRARHGADLERLLANGAGFAIVDLTARAYDGIAAIASAVSAGARVVAVGQHDDVELRQRALAAGAERVYAYRKLFEAGPAVISGWLETGPTERSSPAAAQGGTR